jgi:predicted dehydrogenase
MVLGPYAIATPPSGICRHALSGVPVYADYREMILSGTVDAVVTTLPHYLQPEVAICALENGVHALVDKPAGVYTKQSAR